MASRPTIVLEEHWPDVIAKIDGGLEALVSDVSISAFKQIKAYITAPPGGPSPTARADKPPRKGLIDTSNYINSWVVALHRDGLTGEIGSPVEYGVYLEYGHFIKTKGGFKRVPAYPHVGRAGSLIARNFAGYVKRAFK